MNIFCYHRDSCCSCSGCISWLKNSPHQQLGTMHMWGKKTSSMARFSLFKLKRLRKWHQRQILYKVLIFQNSNFKPETQCHFLPLWKIKRPNWLNEFSTTHGVFNVLNFSWLSYYSVVKSRHVPMCCINLQRKLFLCQCSISPIPKDGSTKCSRILCKWLVRKKPILDLKCTENVQIIQEWLLAYGCSLLRRQQN